MSTFEPEDSTLAVSRGVGMPIHEAEETIGGLQMRRLSDRELLAIGVCQSDLEELRAWLVWHKSLRGSLAPLAIRRAIAEAQLRMDLRAWEE